MTQGDVIFFFFFKYLRSYLRRRSEKASPRRCLLAQMTLGGTGKERLRQSRPGRRQSVHSRGGTEAAAALRGSKEPCEGVAVSKVGGRVALWALGLSVMGQGGM